MPPWQLQEAKARLSEVIDTAAKKGPQFITQRGVRTAVLVSYADWDRIQPETELTMLELLQSGPRGAIPIPPRGKLRMRKPITF